MTVETKLRSAMADAVAPATPDTDRLVSLARRRGMGIRRRRQALGTVGVAAALALAVLAPRIVAVSGTTDAPVADSVAVGTDQGAFDPKQTSPITGRSTAAALLYAVGLQARGTAADFRGQGDGSGPNSYAVFRFTPEGSTPAGEVGVNVQRFGGTAAKPGDDLGGRLAQCDPGMDRCTTTTLADGSRLVTYEDRSNYGDRLGTRRVADLYRTDHVRVVAYASNGLDVTERDEQIARDQPVLSRDQLVAIVSQAWWGPELPTYFVKQGERLTPYHELGGAAVATPSATATGAK